MTKLNHDPVINVEVRRGKKAVSAEVRCEKVKYDSDGKATERDYLFDKEKTGRGLSLAIKLPINVILQCH